ncbi:hypothetical protein MYCTH_2297159 [Thermothelomyces thermophilus ATCC 42464]|uniref:C2H2-type domain-containing protein n=1 Tax=Thermothelomyces thermophilus (strain ATCC 42464 / BCRC 31852 / DSM 1799) TaxID=573729 RepID=G2Q4M1_THET4|nr:uncharacterized protein MYCTH_2297159 [Thermothelomyces thermophilus ATCC 42464]AEO54510.1 hypothetical protein MYCTH_2297159 [Thermothelomyces thermophilus ATCC 42464]
MDLDFDLDAALWAGDLELAVSQQEAHMGVNYGPLETSMPADLLFVEDEGVLPAAPDYSAQPANMPQQPSAPPSTRAVFPAPRSDAGSDDARLPDEGGTPNGVARQRLRRQLSLLSKGWAGDEIRFKNCDASKAIVLHSLAMELGLGYNHDVRSREVSMSRLEPAQAASKSRQCAAHPSSSCSRSSTELDTTLCLPELPTVPEYQVFNVASHASQEPSSQPAQPKGTGTAVNQQLMRRPSCSERISDSISKHVSTLKTSISKSGGRRGPLTETGRRDMRALEAAGGACWRCKVLRRKCDPGSPCRCCLQSVPMPHLGEDAPLWPLIGCRRGPLRNSMPPQLLCPEPKPETRGASGLPRRCRSVDIAEQCLLSAESQRLADMKAVLEGAGHKLSITDPASQARFISFIEAGRYRDRTSLQRSYSSGGTSVSYTELIAIIAWELAENPALLPALEIKSWESFMNMLETACIYEAEVGQTSLVIMSMVCLRHCLEALRLHSANLLSPGEHEDCGGGQCQVECIHSLRTQVSAFVDELSSVIFNKENMRDRRWWLSTFYSLYIQSYVRHALIIIEKQLRFQSSDDVPAEDLTATQYMHLPAVLFTAASAKYDPLLDGRLQYALTDNSVIPETSVPELHHASARVACEVDKWPEAGIRTPYQFLRRLLQIGSLDFFDFGLETTGQRSPLSLASPSSVRGIKVGSPVSLSPSTFEDGLGFPSPSVGQGKRDSWNSRYSAQASTRFSNLSSDSLARTMSTDVTSLYESSFAAVSFCGSVADLNGDVSVDLATINPTALFSAHHNGSSQSLDQVMAESAAARHDGSAAGLGIVAVPTFVCNCCPRAPRHFHTREELTNHEAEKPHPCTQCKKRFKSPTEAERHLNAIHLKADFWSCKALEDPLQAYHTQSYQGTTWDVCGFCGGEFVRKDGDDGVPALDRAELVAHVESVHRISDCDRNKKFYRADNFRQHLKNTHVALPGRWLKALENACRSTAAREGGLV